MLIKIFHLYEYFVTIFIDGESESNPFYQNNRFRYKSMTKSVKNNYLLQDVQSCQICMNRLDEWELEYADIDEEFRYFIQKNNDIAGLNMKLEHISVSIHDLNF